MTHVFNAAVASCLSIVVFVGAVRAERVQAPESLVPKIKTEREHAPLFEAVNASFDIRASSVQSIGFAKRSESNLTTAVVVDGNTWTLDLQKYSVRSPSFEVRVQDASGQLTLVEPPPVQTYVGTVLELPGSEVRASYNDDGEIEAVVYTADGTFGIQPLTGAGIAAQKGEHAVYRNADWVNRRGYACATNVGQHVFDGLADLEPLPDDVPSTASAVYKVAQIALDADFEFFQLNGSNLNATILDIENVINGLETIYESQLNITYEISSMVVRTVDTDPYTATSPTALLAELVSHWNAAPQSSVQRDLLHLFTGKNLDGSTIGIAYIGAVCNRPWAYGLSQSRFTASMPSRVALSAHELGHNWNAQHCNGCTTCTDCCQIMCSGLGGCSGVVTSFGCQEVTQIAAFRDTRTCLETAASDECTTHADCSDGLYCNGAETCVSGSCLPGSPPNCADAIACTTDSCNETTDQCTHTPSNTLCNDSLFCNGTESCNASTGCVTASPPCGAGPCDESVDQCVVGNGGGKIWLVFGDSATVPGIGTVQNEDIVAYDAEAGTWSLVFDGSDVGLSILAIDGMAVLPSGDILLSFSAQGSILGLTSGPNATMIDDSDIVRFVPTSLGAVTAGSFVFYFDGSDVGLTTDDEDVDAVTLTSTGRLVLSTVGFYSVTGASGDDKDLLVFNHLALGSVTSGSFTMYFDGSDAELTASAEDIDAAGLTAGGAILLSTTGSHTATGVFGANEDVVEFTPVSLGQTTSGTYSMLLDLSILGISTFEDVTALEQVD